MVENEAIVPGASVKYGLSTNTSFASILLSFSVFHMPTLGLNHYQYLMEKSDNLK